MRAKWVGLLIAGALALLLVGCSGDGAATVEQAAVAADAAVAEAHEADGHDDEAVADSHDAAGHDDEAAAADGDADANAYLEIAPKDALFLVRMSSFAFTPSVLEVKVGQVVEIAIQNIDPILHDFTIDKIDADLHISYLGGSGEHAHDGMVLEEADLHFALSEAGSGVVHIKVYEPGVYVIYCSVPGHRELGMVGVLRVN
ncbi:MAG: plastocyanin/azurin family copper-binding protein [Dehalococcoidia bacterium]